MGEYYMSTEMLTEMTTLCEEVFNIQPVGYRLVVAVIGSDGVLKGNIKYNYDESEYVFYPALPEPQNVGVERQI